MLVVAPKNKPFPNPLNCGRGLFALWARFVAEVIDTIIVGAMIFREAAKYFQKACANTNGTIHFEIGSNSSKTVHCYLLARQPAPGFS